MSRLGLVLSGGGARGAYEVGVLSYIYGPLAARHGRTPHIDVICATSVGAVNGAFLASHAHDYVNGVQEGVRLWGELELERVLGFGLRQVTGLYRVVFGGKRGHGVFDPRPLAHMVGRSIHWRRLRSNIRQGIVRALTISTTNVPTGRSVLFIDCPSEVMIPPVLRTHSIVRRARIGEHHVLASAAIPLIFPPVEIGNELHCDGGLRLNTPIAPAIHMGADRVLVIGLSTPHAAEDRALEEGQYPGAPFLLGKVLNAFLLDHINSDIQEVQRINDFLRDGIAAFGPDFLSKLNEAAHARGAMSNRRIVTPLVVRPSVDIGRLTGEYLRNNRARFGKLLGRALLSMLDVGEGADADLASYLLFDGDFAKHLMQMGHDDAHARRDELAQFLFSGVSDRPAPQP